MLPSKKSAANNGNRLKKSQHDLFRQAVGIYLKERTYVGSEKFKKSDFVFTETKRELALRTRLESDLHAGNSFTYSSDFCLNENLHLPDQEFCKFAQCVESQTDDLVLSELRRLYGPILCHLSLDLMKVGEQRAAVDLLYTYAYLVAPLDTSTDTNGSHCDDSMEAITAGTCYSPLRFSLDAESIDDPEVEYFTNLISNIASFTTVEEADCDPEIENFRSTKYEWHTTQEVAEKLRACLENHGHLILMELLQMWIYVHVVDNEVRKFTDEFLFFEDSDENESSFDTEPTVLASSSSNAFNRVSVKVEEPDEVSTMFVKSEPLDDVDETSRGLDLELQNCLRSMEEAREELIKAQTEFPRFIKLAEKSRGLTTAHIDANECHLAAGFNNSIVQLWQLNQEDAGGKNLYQPYEDSLCRWEVNNCSHEVDTIEGDIRRRTITNIREQRKIDQFEASKYEDNSYDEYGGVQLLGHGRGVTDVRFSSHYPLLYSVSKDATMRIWRAECFTCARIYRGHHYPIWCVGESPLGTYAATGSKDSTARLWSLERQFPLITFAGHTLDVESLSFHPNGSYIATGSSDVSVRMWSIQNGKVMRVFSDCKQPVTSVAFSPDGRLLAAGSLESKVRIFDLAAGSQLSELKDHTASVTSLEWSPDGQHLATVCSDGSLRVWDVKRLVPIVTESSGSGTSPPSTQIPNRLVGYASKCERLVRVSFGRNERLCCIGSSK